jgi:hypothetical protein
MRDLSTRCLLVIPAVWERQGRDQQIHQRGRNHWGLQTKKQEVG